MENHHFSWENPLLMAIFNSYVKLPEGISLLVAVKLSAFSADVIMKLVLLVMQNR
jgi:hypothetical protein